MTSSKNLKSVIPTTCRMGTLYIKYNHLIDLWVKFGSSKLISYVPARDPIFAKMVKKVMTSSRNLKRVIAPPYQLGQRVRAIIKKS